MSGPFVVHADFAMVEVVARGAGPAGSVGVELFDGEVSIDLDGADVSELVAVRVHLSAGFPHRPTRASDRMSQVQRLFVEAFFGDRASFVLDATPNQRPVRAGSRRPVASSLDSVEVDKTVTSLVVASDALGRSVLAPELQAILALTALTAAKESGVDLGGPLAAHCRTVLGHLPKTLPVDGLDGWYQGLLTRSLRVGVLAGPSEVSPLIADAPETKRPLLDVVHPRDESSSLQPVYARADRPVPTVHPTVVDDLVAKYAGVAVTLDSLSMIVGGVSWGWTGTSTLTVKVPPTGGQEALWVRLRAEDGTILAAAPVVNARDVYAEVNLLAVQRPGLVLDVASSLTSRVLDARVAALCHAAECGQSAGRLERLGDLAAASLKWEECASWHRVSGDAPREKLALSRAVSPQSGQATLLDALLEGRTPTR